MIVIDYIVKMTVISVIIQRVYSTNFERVRKSCSYNLSCFTPRLECFRAKVNRLRDYSSDHFDFPSFSRRVLRSSVPAKKRSIDFCYRFMPEKFSILGRL